MHTLALLCEIELMYYYSSGQAIDGDETVVADIGRDGVDDARVVLCDPDLEQPAVEIHRGHPGLLLLTPRQVQSNEVHAATLPHPGRKL